MSPLQGVGLTIGEVAQRVGLNPSAIRYYEHEGLVPLPARLNGRRRYGPEVIQRLHGIQRARQLGFTIAEIKMLFNGKTSQLAPSAQWRKIAERKLPELDRVIQSAQAMKTLLEATPNCSCPTIEDCFGSCDTTLT